MYPGDWSRSYIERTGLAIWILLSGRRRRSGREEVRTNGGYRGTDRSTRTRCSDEPIDRRGSPWLFDEGRARTRCSDRRRLTSTARALDFGGVTTMKILVVAANQVLDNPYQTITERTGLAIWILLSGRRRRSGREEVRTNGPRSGRRHNGTVSGAIDANGEEPEGMTRA